MPVEGASELTICVIIPAFNEAEHIAGVIKDVPLWVDAIIVVDDASTDHTSLTANNCGDPRVVAVRRALNGGVGAAMRTGYELALEGRYELIAKMDGDGQMLPEELARLVEPFRLRLADYSKGNRFVLAGRTAGMPAHRHFGNNALSFLTKLASGYWHVFDSQCGFTVIRRGFLHLINMDSIADGYFFENSMLIQLNGLGARVVDVPVSTVYGRERSGIRISQVLLSFPLRLIADGTKRHWRRHLITEFSAIGITGLIGWFLTSFGILFGAYHWYGSISSGTPAATGTVMIAALSLLAGLSLLLQAFSFSVTSSPGAQETAYYVRELIQRGDLD